ncbi:MAG: proton-conducting transporter membrane subunit [Candidatus Omnitrophica bacterium]|nr:proton-conducting transporter membrane subunit [Candidatus Omnitrophota bacterium]
MSSVLILVPLFGIIGLNMLPRNVARRAAFWFAAAVFTAEILLAIVHQPAFWTEALVRFDSFFRLKFSVDSLSRIMLICIGVVSLSSLVVAKSTVSDEKEAFKFINILITASIGMSGIVMVKDIFSLYVFLEIAALSSFILIAFNKDINGLEGAFKYLILSAVATVLMLTSIAILLLDSPDTAFSTLHNEIAHSRGNFIVTFAIGLFICGLFIKGGLVPFHGWLPDAYMAAPAPVSILLAGVMTKACGIYTLMRIVASVFGFTDPIKNTMMLIGMISILVGAFAALGQTNFKRMLAYSSISQVGYIILGAGTGTFLGLAGAAFHLFNHAIFKGLLFVNSAALEEKVGTSDMSRMGGLSERMPVTGATSVIAMLSASGVPPLAGFWSKLLIVIALWQIGHYAYAAIAILASVLTLAYFLYMQRQVFFGKLPPGLEGLREAGNGLTLTASALAVITVGAGLAFPYIYNHFLLPLKEIFF